jgi:hypothetical protein
MKAVLPPVLYKYRPLSPQPSQEFTRLILVDGKVYFASPEQLNHPFETRFTIIGKLMK